ncbi:hypothetical protein PCASD_24242 [Puccinia coronata f. sp. avenae]|uniref:Reverse transcriptase domain-containing protein n=1 Tax=Puccinia coronata f. sp. avenae TaxID=200324 RepID=A0A2N5THN4_9BASI|nr:hypothetical protein PCASD_24242 [Puccinia coronata f. sp. avenae]
MTENGFPPYLVDWIQSYLSCRAVKISDGAATEPSFTPIQVGIPQAANELQRQANRSGMNFDISKTELFHFPSNRTPVPDTTPSVQVGEHTVENSTKIRWVGIFFDRSMRAGYHIETRATKARKALYRIAPLLKNSAPKQHHALSRHLLFLHSPSALKCSRVHTSTMMNKPPSGSASVQLPS